MTRPSSISPSVETLMLALLGFGEGKANLDDLVKRSQLSASRTVEALAKIHKEGFVQMLDGVLCVTSSRRIDIVMSLLNSGTDVESISKAAGWQEFEQLGEAFLKTHGYATRRHFRYSSSRRRYELDLIALKKPCLLSIECKRWKRSWQSVGIHRIVISHLARTQSLSEILRDYKEKLGIADWKAVEIFPIVLMLSDTPSRAERGVPIVPIHRFRDFLIELEGHLDEFPVFRCQL